MPPIKKDDLGAPKKPLTPEQQAYRAGRQQKWAQVHSAIEAGDVEAAKAGIKALQDEATARYRAENGEA